MSEGPNQIKKLGTIFVVFGAILIGIWLISISIVFEKVQWRRNALFIMGLINIIFAIVAGYVSIRVRKDFEVESLK
jgi:hypothetical protein